MADWREEMEVVLTDFEKVSQLVGANYNLSELQIEFLKAPHSPSGLPKGKMAVYAFWGEGEWLKIGKVGAKSNARYRSQHYSVGRAKSSLANSLCNDAAMIGIRGLSVETCSDWIKTNTHRCNILVLSSYPKSWLSLLEAFLHCRLHPRYEG